MIEKRLMTLNEFCEYTGWSKTKAREIVKRDNVDFVVKLGNKYFVIKDAFDSYLKNCAVHHIPI